MRRMKQLLSIFSLSSQPTENVDWLVCRLAEAPEVSDLWDRKVMRLCDGRSIRDLISTLYSQEVGQGGWVADIGMWKPIFDEQVIRTVHNLVEQGFLRLDDGAGTAESRDSVGQF